MGVPLKRPAEGVEDTDETRNKVPAFKSKLLSHQQAQEEKV